jgi:mRNA interferase RelE/StbE
VAVHRLRILDDVAALIRGLHPSIKKKVRAGLEAILDAPASGKALKDELAGLRSYRLGKLRIVYRVAKGRVIELVAVGPRRHIFEVTYRKVRGEVP